MARKSVETAPPPVEGTSAYLAMQREVYADLVRRSDYESGGFAASDTAELVVGSYAQHEAFGYESWLFGGLAIDPSAVALEYGCGPGRMLLRTAPLFRRVDGVDISPDVLAVARRRCGDAGLESRLYVTDGDGVPADCRDAYDVVFSVICLQHVCVHEVRRRILETFFHALRPGGIVSFQLGYGPGHPHMREYQANDTEAQSTNGGADAGVLHPGEVAADLAAIGFASAAYALTPSGPGDSHAAWIFVRAIKPAAGAERGPGAVPSAWTALGFQPMRQDPAAVARARTLHLERGLLAHYRHAAAQLSAADSTIHQLEERIQALTGQLQQTESVCAAITTDRDRLAEAAAAQFLELELAEQRAGRAAIERQQLERRVDVMERQLLRLRVADRLRLRAIIAVVACEAREHGLRVGVFGAGVHTTWLLRETELGSIAGLQIFDSYPAAWQTPVGGIAVRPAAEIAQAQLDRVIVSSLAFQDEMSAFLQGLGVSGMQIVRCYPQPDGRAHGV